MTPKAHRFTASDGCSLAYVTLGEGRPALLLHGLLANADANWLAPGVAHRIAGTGRHVIVPDLRGHGDSDKPVDAAAYPPDVLARDQEELLANLGIESFDLAGYSLGARTAVRMLARGVRPSRVVLGGMGDSGIVSVERGRAFFEDLVRNGAASQRPEAGRLVHAMMERGGLSSEAILYVLAQQLSTAPDVLACIDVPTLVISGAEDEDNGSAEGLAVMLPDASARRVPGNHMTAFAQPAFADQIVAFLNGA